ncbi:MAG: Clp protease N-terminal domain-containing protein [Hyphomicrobiaceae bacterium]|nr:Clp protease N-terminal domain-containing protein [Hyphomicrobiaceae bacterium]
MIADDLATRIPMSPFLTATLARAADYATAQSHVEVTVEHLLLALTEDPEASVVLKTSNVDVTRLNNEVSDFIGRIEERHPEGTGGSVAISADLRRILEAAAAAAQQGRRREINGAIVLAAIVGDGKSGAAHMLRSQGLTFEEAIRALQRAAAQTARPPAPAPAPAPAPPQASAADILASARERVQTRSAPGLRESRQEPEPAEPERGLPPLGGGTPRFESGPPPEVEQQYEPEPAPSLSHKQDGRTERELDDAFRQINQPGSMGSLSTEPEQHLPNFGAPPTPAPPAREMPLADPQLDPFAAPGLGGPPLPAGQPSRGPAGPSQDRSPSAPRRQQSWAPPAPRGAPPNGPGGPGPRGGRIPPPLPPSPGPLQIPGQTPAQFPVGPGGPGGQSPSPAGAAGPRGVPPQSRVPWPEAIDPPSAPQGRPEGANRQRQAGPRTVISAGQLAHNVPPRMKVGVSLVCEARIGRAEVKAIVEGLQGGGSVVRQEIMVTKAMSVRLRSPDGGFFIEGSSPETQWIENVLGLPAEDYARWRWTITPREKGRKRLQLIVSARTVGSDGLAAETAMPDQVIEIRVRTNYARSLKRWLGWALAAIVGGVLARFGETAFEAAKGLFGMFNG